MNASPEQRLKELGIQLPEWLAPVSGYVGILQVGNFLWVSGQLCYGPGAKLVSTGRLGADVSIEEARYATRCCALNVLGRAKAELGSLDRIKRIVRIGGFLVTTPEFTEHAAAMGSVTELILDVFGEAGRHARATIGVASLPLGSTAQVDAVIEIA